MGPDRAALVVSTGLLRDQFLQALDSDNREAAVRLAGFLGNSTNPLPSEVCAQLGLPKGSDYSAAARKIVADPALPVPPLHPSTTA
jgi:hypothetical protein